MISAFGIDHGSPISKAANPLAAVGRRVATAQIRSGERTTNRGYRLVEVAAQRASTLPDELNGHDLVRAKRLSRAGARGISAVNRGQKRIANGQRHAASATKTGAVVIAVPVAAGGSYAGYKKVTKSLVPGKGFVKASELTAKERKVIGAGKTWRRARKMTPEDRKFKALYPKLQEAAQTALAEGNGLTKKGKLRTGMFGGTAATFRFGGKNTGHSVIVGRGVSKPSAASMLAHEAQHAIPRRSAYRLHHQIMKDPNKLMREEARADYRSGGHYQKHHDAGSVYAQGARAIRGLDTQGESAQFKFKKKTRKAFEATGEVPRLTNRDAVENIKNALDAKFPHYQLSSTAGGQPAAAGYQRGDNALRAYAGLHDQMKAKGVPQGKNRKIF